jgi:cytochrome P450
VPQVCLIILSFGSDKSEFLFGESVHSLLATHEEFADAFTYSQDICTMRIKMGPLRNIHIDRKFDRETARVKAFADRFVAKAIKDFKSGELAKEKDQGGRYIFLRELARVTQDPIELRDQLLNILLAGRDTTAGLLSNTFHALARHPRVFDKLREEISQLGDQRPTFEQIKDLKYLKSVVNEGKYAN